MLQSIQWIGVAYRLAQFREWSCFNPKTGWMRGQGWFWNYLPGYSLSGPAFSSYRNWRVNGVGSQTQTGIQFDSEIERDQKSFRRRRTRFSRRITWDLVCHTSCAYEGHILCERCPLSLKGNAFCARPFGVRDAGKRWKTSEGVADKEKSLF